MMRDESHASLLPAGGVGQLLEHFRYFVAILGRKAEADDQTDHSPGFLSPHRANQAYVCRPPKASANSGRMMVWSRSGPVEIMPIRAPLSRSWKRRYSRAALGSRS